MLVLSVAVHCRGSETFSKPETTEPCLEAKISLTCKSEAPPQKMNNSINFADPNVTQMLFVIE